MEGVGEEVYFFVFLAVLFHMFHVYFLWKLATHSTDQTDIIRRGRTLSTPYECPICYEDAQLAVETNCGHVFCSNCLLEVWRRSSQLSAISCPYCRQKVTLMLPYFTQEENNAAVQALAHDRKGLVAEITLYDRIYSGEPLSVTQQLRDLPIRLRHLLPRLITLENLVLSILIFSTYFLVCCHVFLVVYGSYPN